MKNALMVRPEMLGAGLIGLAGLTVIGLIPDAQQGVVLNWAVFLVRLLGWGYYLAWVVLGYLGVWLIRKFGLENQDERWEKPAGAMLVLLVFAALAEVFDPGHSGRNGDFGGGGSVGWFIAQLFSPWGTLLLFAPSALLASVVLIGPWTMRDLYNRAGKWLKALRRQYRRQRIPVKAGDSVAAVKPPARATAAPPPAPVAGNSRWRIPEIARVLSPAPARKLNPDAARKRAQIIEQTLSGLGIEASVKDIEPGPVVTRFAIDPGYTGGTNPDGSRRRTSVKKIARLEEDLALALAASPVRIEAPIPGLPYVGIEAPNRARSPVTLRGVLEKSGVTPLTYPRHSLQVPLGESVDGKGVVIDLAGQPHLLIAGATGSGKSVCLNAIISGLLCYHTPETLRLVMFDPKQVELAEYNGIPHLLSPVVTDVAQAGDALSWATREMERRYRALANSRARNIGVYNAKMAREGKDKLPFIVLVIDELADLMIAAAEAVEQPVVRLAQKARAVGMHLVVATQRPSTDVVTGLIKANFPARIAFAVASQTDSRVILDQAGANKLLGQGDMLYQSPRSAHLQRLQGAYISDREVAALARFWRRQSGKAGAAKIEFSREADQPAQGKPDKGDDVLLRRASALVRKKGRASTSMLQREFKIGYARAAKIMDALEEKGVIGPAQSGNRAREVFAKGVEK